MILNFTTTIYLSAYLKCDDRNTPCFKRYLKQTNRAVEKTLNIVKKARTKYLPLQKSHETAPGRQSILLRW